jgi:hypothetical protein
MSSAQFQDSVYDEAKRQLAEQIQRRTDTSDRPGTTRTAVSPPAKTSTTKIRLTLRRRVP